MIDSKDRKHFKKPQSNAPRSRMEATILLRKGKKEELDQEIAVRVRREKKKEDHPVALRRYPAFLCFEGKS